MKCPMAALTSLSLSTILIFLVPLKTYRGMKVLNEELVKSLVNINAMLDALEAMCKEVTAGKRMGRTEAQNIDNAKVNLLWINISREECI